MAALQYQTLRERVAVIIRNKIIHMEYKPGERIIEQELAEEFQTSRGPVREALRDLENEGLIVYTRNVGCTVKEIDLDECYEIYLLRATYETMAVKLMNGVIPEETIEEMESILKEMENLTVNEYEKIVEYDNAFHGALVKMPGMERIQKSWSVLSFVNIATGYSENLDKKKRLEHQYPSHKVIIDACRLGDCKVICKAISDHYWRTISRITEDQESDCVSRKKAWDQIFE